MESELGQTEVQSVQLHNARQIWDRHLQISDGFRILLF